jgi:hypothetical protein
VFFDRKLEVRVGETEGGGWGGKRGTNNFCKINALAEETDETNKLQFQTNRKYDLKNTIAAIVTVADRNEKD